MNNVTPKHNYPMNTFTRSRDVPVSKHSFLFHVSSLIRQPWYKDSTCSHLLTKTHPAVEIIIEIKPLGCLLLKCLLRTRTTRSNDGHASYFTEAHCFLAPQCCSSSAYRSHWEQLSSSRSTLGPRPPPSNICYFCIATFAKFAMI